MEGYNDGILLMLVKLCLKSYFLAIYLTPHSSLPGLRYSKPPRI